MNSFYMETLRNYAQEILSSEKLPLQHYKLNRLSYSLYILHLQIISFAVMVWQITVYSHIPTKAYQFELIVKTT